MNTRYDVLIIGGGPAGLSAAMSLARMKRSVLICDDNRPRNKPALHMNNFVSHDGLNPIEWRTKAKLDLKKYPSIDFYEGSIIDIEQTHTGFSAIVNSASVHFRKVILAYGIQDKLLDIPGFIELWGKSIFHCPYCHGHEVQNSPLGLIANGKFAEHLLPMIYSLSSDTILFTNGQASLDEKIKKHIDLRQIKIIETPMKKLIYENDSLEAIVLADNEIVERRGIFIAPQLPFQSKSSIGSILNCEKTEMGFHKIDNLQKTTTPNVFAAGDITTPMHSVLAAAASGQFAGAAAVSELIQEDFHNM